MNINFLGINSFKVQSKDIVLITDPFGKETGLKPVRAKADIVLVTKKDLAHNYTSGIQGDPFIIDKEGEYEIKGVFIQGFSPKNSDPKNKSIIYLIEIEGIRLLHLGDLTEPLSSEEQEKFNSVNVMMVPVGEKGMIKIGEAVELINQIEPEIVIPMHYALPGLKEKVSSLSKFCEEMGASSKGKLEKLSVKKKDLGGEDEETKVYILQQT